MINRIGFIASSLLVLLAIASSTLFVVDQRQFGVVFQFGQIRKVVTEPGLNVKLPPPFQNVSYIDKRLLTLESTDTEPTLTAEKQRVVIDWYVRWRISDPSAYIRNVGVVAAAAPADADAPWLTCCMILSSGRYSRLDCWRVSISTLVTLA